MMTRTQLREIGVALYGPRFASSLARTLARPVNVRTVERWVDGTRPIPAGLPGELRKLLEEREKFLRELTARLAA